MVKIFKNNSNLLIFVLLNAFFVFMLSNSVLMSQYVEIRQMNITNIDKFIVIVAIIMVIIYLFLMLVQSIAYKLILLLFPLEIEISFLRNMSHLLKGTVPLFIVCLLYQYIFKKDDLFDFINQGYIRYLNIIISLLIYLYFLAKDLRLPLKQSVLIGVFLVTINLILSSIYSLFI